MSIDVMKEVWDSAPVEQGTLLVFLCLADNADKDSRTCFPGITSLSKRSRLSTRQVQRALVELANANCLTVERNKGPGGTNLYTILPVEAWTRDLNEPELPLLGGVKMSSQTGADTTFCHGGGDAHVTPDTTPMSPKPSENRQEPSDSFDAFWKIWPKHERKVAKGQCRDKYLATVNGKRSGVDPVTGDQINEALKRFLLTVRDPQYLPAPLVWLNQCRWEPFVDGAIADSGDQPNEFQRIAHNLGRYKDTQNDRPN